MRNKKAAAFAPYEKKECGVYHMCFISTVKQNIAIDDAKEENERFFYFAENHRKTTMVRG